MTRERELLLEALEWMDELKYVWAESRNTGDRVLLELIAGINKIEKLLAQPEQEPDLWVVTNAHGINEYIYSKPREQVTEAYKVTEYYKQPPKREPLSEVVIDTYLDSYKGNKQSFWDGVEWAEKEHGIGVDNE